MRRSDKRKEPNVGRLWRKALRLVLTALIPALTFTAFAAYAAMSAGLFSAGTDGGYRVSTKDGVTKGGTTTEIATTTDPDTGETVPDWRQDPDKTNTWYLYLAGEEEQGKDPVVTLVMDGNTWTYYFTVVDDATAEYYVTEFINREGDYELTADPSYQLVNEDGSVLYYTKTGSNGSVTLYNRLKDEKLAFGGLTLTKKVENADDTSSFLFTVRLSYTLKTDADGKAVDGTSATVAALLTGTQSYGNVIVEWTQSDPVTDDGITAAGYTGTAAVYLKAGESVTLTDLPAGVAYSVSETDTKGYTKAWTGADDTALTGEPSGVIEENTTAAFTCTNTKESGGGGDPDPTGMGSVRVEKLVCRADGTEAEDDQGIFSMRVSLTGLKAGASYSYTLYNAAGEVVQRAAQDGEAEDCTDTYTALADGSADVSLLLLNGQYAGFSGLPVGCGYQVMESAAEGYTASYELSGGGGSPVYASSRGTNYEENLSLTTAKETLDPEEAADAVTVTFKNTLPDVPAGNASVSVTVTKRWQDPDGQDDSESHAGEEVIIYLLQTLEPEETDGADVVGTAYLNGTDDGWTYAWENLDRYTDGGQTYYYYIKEERINGCSTALSVTEAPCLDENGNVIYETDEDGNYILDAAGEKIIAYDEEKDYSFTVTNRASRELPKTGGSGTLPFLLLGLALTAAPAGCLSAARRRRVREVK